MAYEFTITDSFNRSEDEILKQAFDIAQCEIKEQDLDSDLNLKMVSLKEDGSNKVYSFALVAQDESDVDDDTFEAMKSSQNNNGIAASQI